MYMTTQHVGEERGQVRRLNPGAHRCEEVSEVRVIRGRMIPEARRNPEG